MRAISRRLRRLEDILSPQEGEGPRIAEILRAARWHGIAGGQASPSRTVAGAKARTMAEIVRTVGGSGGGRPEKKMISRSLTRRLEHLESRFEPVGEPVGEPTIINVNFVDKDLKVVDADDDRGTHERRWPASASMVTKMINVGLSRLLTSCGAGVGAVQRPTNACRLASDICP
jgi:hypothetical protein